jgi:hypothetical protein
MADYNGSCFCGAVEFTASGAPMHMGYCHCNSCRSWSASPVNAFALWAPDAVKVTKGAGNVGAYMKADPGTANRKFCNSCGGHLFTEHPKWGMNCVYPASVKGLEFKPGLHVYYGEKMISMKDGLPKMKDAPKEMGGSGDTLPE